MTDVKVKISNLFKIFGPNPNGMMELVQDGITKYDLLEQKGHVLGLRDINIDVPAHRIQVIMGLSGSGKSTQIGRAHV